VRVIGKDGEQLGILNTREAVQLADSMSLDLVQVADKADPPVCKIMDYGKYKYEEKKKTKEARKKQTVVEVKEIQIRPKTETHDIRHKAKSAIGFLEEGDKVKVTVFYRGREMEHLEVGWQTLKEFLEELQDRAVLETNPKMEGKRLGCMLASATGKKLAPGHLIASLPPPPPPRNRGMAPGGPNFGGPNAGGPGGFNSPTAAAASAPGVAGPAGSGGSGPGNAGPAPGGAPRR
jgi:translation initiation factor IF-3